MKGYREWKTTDCKQELEIVKKHNSLPQNRSQFIKLKLWILKSFIYSFNFQDLILKANYLK